MRKLKDTLAIIVCVICAEQLNDKIISSHERIFRFSLNILWQNSAGNRMICYEIMHHVRKLGTSKTHTLFALLSAEMQANYALSTHEISLYRKRISKQMEIKLRFSNGRKISVCSDKISILYVMNEKFYDIFNINVAAAAAAAVVSVHYKIMMVILKWNITL